MIHRSFMRRRYQLRGLSSIRCIHDFDFLDLNRSDNISEDLSPLSLPSHVSTCAASAVSRILILQDRAERRGLVMSSPTSSLTFARRNFASRALSSLARRFSSFSRGNITVFPLVRAAEELPSEQSRRLTRPRSYRHVSYLQFCQGLSRRMLAEGLSALHLDRTVHPGIKNLFQLQVFILYMYFFEIRDAVDMEIRSLEAIIFL